MTPERWSTLCQSLDALTGPQLEQAIASHRVEVMQWPATVRRLEASSPWLKGVFEGAFDPRLELVGHATIEQRLEGRGVQYPLLFELVRALAAHLDPSFNPPDVVLEEEDNIRSAYGCGGGSAWWTRGNAQHTVRFHSNASESPSMGMRSHDSWTASGLPEGCSLVIEMDDFADGLGLVASGPCPWVLELAPAWAAAVRGADLAELRRVLEATRVPWDRPVRVTKPAVSSLPPPAPPGAADAPPSPRLAPVEPASHAPTSSPKPAPDLSALPTALLGALFVAEDLKLACRIERGNGIEEEGAYLLTTVFSGVGKLALLLRAHTRWHPVTKPNSESAFERLGRLEAELGIVGAGNLYRLYVVRKNPDNARFGPKEWIAAQADTPLAELRLFPEHGQSPYMPDDWDWQEGWWYPYSTFRPATPAELAAHSKG